MRAARANPAAGNRPSLRVLRARSSSASASALAARRVQNTASWASSIIHQPSRARDPPGRALEGHPGPARFVSRGGSPLPFSAAGRDGRRRGHLDRGGDVPRRGASDPEHHPPRVARVPRRARAPATPATPAGQRVFGVDANAPPKTAFATDAFLRRVPATARPATARPATARPPIVGATSRTLAPTPTKTTRTTTTATPRTSARTPWTPTALAPTRGARSSPSRTSSARWRRARRPRGRAGGV